MEVEVHSTGRSLHDKSAFTFDICLQIFREITQRCIAICLVFMNIDIDHDQIVVDHDTVCIVIIAIE